MSAPRCQQFSAVLRGFYGFSAHCLYSLVREDGLAVLAALTDLEAERRRGAVPCLERIGQKRQHMLR